MEFTASLAHEISNLVRSKRTQVNPLTLHDFTRQYWPVIENRPFVDNWHIGLMSEFLTAIIRREILRGIINIPPRFMKPVNEETQVLMANGERKRLKEIEEGDFVITHKGRARRVNKVSVQGELPVICFRTYSGRTVSAEKSHPFLTPSGWKEAGDLEVGHVLATLRAPQTVPNPENCTDLKISEARLAGYFVGDGCTTQTRNDLQSNIVCHDPRQEESIIEHASILGFQTHKHERSHRINISGGSRPWLREVGLSGKGSAEKRVPGFVFEGDSRVVAAFLAAYFETDGTLNARRGIKKDVQIVFNSINRDLLEDVQHLLLRLGVRSAIRDVFRPKGTNFTNGKPHLSYRLQITSMDDAWRFVNTVPVVGQKAVRLKNWALKSVKYDHNFIEDPIVEIEYSTGRCRCLSIEEDHSFTANDLVVHNSTLVNVMWPAWTWGEETGPRGASEQFFFSSYASDLVLRDSDRCRNLVTSGPYQLRYSEVFQLTRGQNAKHFYTNNRAGYRLCTSVGGGGTGKGGDILCIDDPVKIEEAHSDVVVQGANDWFDHTFSQRMNDPLTTAILLIMHRLVPNDLSGHIAELDEEGDWVTLRLPNQLEHDFKCFVFFDGHRLKNPVKPLEKLPEWQRHELEALPARQENETLAQAKLRLKDQEFVYMADPRKDDNELLWPHRFNVKATASARRTLRGKYPGQYQQRPVALTGGAIHEEWFKFWVPPDRQNLPPHSVRLETGEMVFCDQRVLPSDFADRIQSWDLSFKDTSGSSRVSGQVWARYYGSFFLLDNDTRHLNVKGTILAIIRMSKRHPNAYGKLIEDKANGPAVMQMLLGKLAGIIPINPKDSKESRVNGVSYLIEAGDVWLPHPLLAEFPWVYDFMAEFISFPGTYTDQVDAACQALLRLARQLDALNDEEIMSISQVTYA